MELDLRQLMHIAWRRWWIVALLMVVAGAAAWWRESQETPLYSTSATMLVEPGQNFTGMVDYNRIIATERLAETYPQLITNGDMRDRVAETLGMDFVPSSISATMIESSQLILVSVVDTDPERAALVANTVVSEFQTYIDERAQDNAESASAGIQTDISLLQDRVAEIDERLNELNAADDVDDPAVQRQLDDLTRERSALTESIIDLNTNAVTIESNIIAGSASVDPAGTARVPTDPFEPTPRRALMLGLFVGLLLGVGLVALLEFLDNTVKPEQNIHALTGAPLLATISTLGKLPPGGGQVYTMSQPRSSAAEALRLLRTNLEFASASGEIGSMTLTSPGPGEGKSTIAANLGVVMAQSGVRTVVIDADLRKPTQYRIFGVQNDVGLTTLLTHPEQEWGKVAKKVALQGLELIPSGPLPPNPADLLSSARFEALLDQIKSDVDLVIIDSPPVLSASDTLAIATHTDGVVLVCDSGRTRIDAMRHASHAVHQGGIRLVGVVLNRQRGQHGASYYGEYYGPATATGD